MLESPAKHGSKTVEMEQEEVMAEWSVHYSRVRSLQGEAMLYIGMRGWVDF